MCPEQDNAVDLTAALPLLTHTSPSQSVAWRKGRSVSVAEFLADVTYLAARLPAGSHMLNVCRDRYRFAVGLAAGIISNKISLLPPTHTPDMVLQMQAYSSDVFCLHDQPECDTALPRMLYPAMPEYHNSAESLEAAGTGLTKLDMAIPSILATQQVAVVFTSGSTGTPLPHIKRWGSLVRNVQAQAEMLGLASHTSPKELSVGNISANDIHPSDFHSSDSHLSDTGYSIVGTIPPQHMYGFESTVLLAWQSANALHAGQPFYPADICSALAACAMPRVLVSTPLHLRLLLESGLEIPQASLVLSATAPLSVELAQRAEASFQAPLVEIYGSTETGQIATRRTAASAEWQLFPGVQLTQRNSQIWAEQGHIDKAVPLGDVIEIKPNRHFLLHGRTQDMINIAGKRTSLANLNHHLNSIPGVIDGAFYMPDEASPDHVTRLAACVVAPTLTQAQLFKQLRLRMDAVFLPRPLLFASELPRNSTGKLPRTALRQLVQSLQKPTELNECVEPNGQAEPNAPAQQCRENAA